MARNTVCLVFLLYFGSSLSGQSLEGYKLWLKYNPVTDQELVNRYQSLTSDISFLADSEVGNAAKSELSKGLQGMLGQAPVFTDGLSGKTTLLVARLADISQDMRAKIFVDEVGEDGFIIQSIDHQQGPLLCLLGHNDTGLLYGVFRLLQMMQAGQVIDKVRIVDAPRVDLRLLNHWDNLDRTVERGYAGFSIWNWQKLPGYIDKRYIDYARANASIGINGTVLTNVNANAQVLTPMYLEKVAALADVFRPYGIKVYLTARFSAPIEIGGLETADPLDASVQAWWNKKVAEIYTAIPDFGGFLVKANSEGQPGPQDYNRTHVDGANMMARALAPFNGIVMWRAFVYSADDKTDRARQAYDEFVPFNGKFEENVLIQAKNGAIDFQPREPFHPIFGAMPETPLMMEFQITQEYLGFSSHLVFLPKLFEEVLQSETYRKGRSSRVAQVVDGSLHNYGLTGMAGVSNIGTDMNWTGHPFAQANWYGFGRLAWNPNLGAAEIAREWLMATYSSDTVFINKMTKLMLDSREAVVNYMMPLGLHHLFDTDHHYGPGPWVDDLSRPEWNPTYYHQADSSGIGFDRTPTGSNATDQYAEALAKQFNDPKTCPEELLLWFHHLPWDHRLMNGQILWDGIALKYQEGVDQVREMIVTWEAIEGLIPGLQYEEVRMLLEIQLKEAIWWKDACLSYFQNFSGMELPEGVEKPLYSLEYYQSLKFPFAPGIRPRWD